MNELICVQIKDAYLSSLSCARISSFSLIPHAMPIHHEAALYDPALIALYRRMGADRYMTPSQFHKLYVQHVPEASEYALRPFAIRAYTGPHAGRPRSIVINPNRRNWWERFLWDIRRTFGPMLDNIKTRVNLFLHGRPLAAKDLHTLRQAPPYALQVKSDANGAFELPTQDPLQVELERKRMEEARRRSELEQTAASGSGVANSVKAIRVLDSVCRNVASDMADLSIAANRGGSGNKFRVVGDPLAAYAAASKALRDPKVYEPLGYSSANDFFTQDLHAKNAAEAIDSLACDISSRMPKMPQHMARPTRERLAKMYESRIGGSLISQWRDTVRHWLGQRPQTASSGRFHLRSDYSLAVSDPSGNAVRHPFAWDKRVSQSREHARSLRGKPMPEHVFEEDQFLGRSQKGLNHDERVHFDRGMLRSGLSSWQADDNVASAVDVPGSSLVGATPQSLSEPIASSLPDAVPYYDAARDRNGAMTSAPSSIPELVSYDDRANGAVGVSVDLVLPSSMPRPIPIADLDCNPNYGFTAPTPVSSMPDAIPVSSPEPSSFVREQISDMAPSPMTRPTLVAETISAGEDKAPAQMPVFSSMINVDRFDTRSVHSDALTREMTRNMLNSDEYSAIIVPDIDAETNNTIAAKLASKSGQEHSSAIAPYQFPRSMTSASLNRLTSGVPVSEFPLVTRNGGFWRVSANDKGQVMVRNTKTDKLVQAQVSRMKERPEMLVIRVPILHVHGQSKKK